MKTPNPVSVCRTPANPSENGNCADADTADGQKMSLNLIQALADSVGITLSTEADRIVIDGPADRVDELVPMIRHWKPELIRILQGRTVGSVGTCDCGSSLLGLPTRDGFVNRVCGDCGRWFRCRDPFHDWTDLELIELLNERISIIQQDGRIDPAEAENMAVQWLGLVIGENRLYRIVSDARSDIDSTQNTPKKIVPENENCGITKKWLPDASTPDSLSTQLTWS